MSLEQPRKIPPDVLARFGQLGRELSTIIVLFHARVAEQLGLSATDHKCLELVIQAGQPITAGRVARLSGLSTGAVTGVLDRLERHGFVRRVRDPHDRRKVLVELADVDEPRHRQLLAGVTALTERVLSHFTPQEWDVIERYNRAILAEYRDIVDHP